MNSFQFKTTDAREGSVSSFIEGLFGHRDAVPVEEVSRNDTLLSVSITGKNGTSLNIQFKKKREN